MENDVIVHPKDGDENNKRDSAILMNFAALNQLVLKNLKNTTSQKSSYLQKYSREQVSSFLESPDKNEKKIRDLSRLLYNKSSHYKRLIQYFAKMLTLDYLVQPYNIDYEKANKKALSNQYKKVVQFLDLMNIKHEFSKILNIAFRDDVFYGYEHRTNNSYFIQSLDPDFCTISSIEDGCYNFAFDFSYFDTYKDQLNLYPKEFKTKYNAFKKDSSKKLQELDSKNTICIKINEELTYPYPPFTAVFEAIFDIEDFKALRKDRQVISNYKMIHQKLPIRSDSEDNNDFLIDFDSMMFYHNALVSILPEEVGGVTTPMELKEINFEKDSADSDNVERATRDYWTLAGVSEPLFNSGKGGSVGLEYSIRTDEEIVFVVLRQIERWINRRIKFEFSNINFKVSMPNLSVFNFNEVHDSALKASEFGYPTKMLASAALGFSPSAVVDMAILENEILGLTDRFIPVQSSHTSPSGDEGGAPKKKTSDLTEEGAKARDK